MSWRGPLVVVLLIGAGVSGWAVWREGKAPKPKAVASDRPDYVLHDFEMVALNGEGIESFSVRAPRLDRRPDERTLSLKTPIFEVPNGEGRYWEIRSDTGWVSADQSEIRLIGAVKANSPPDSVRPITLNTGRLSVFPRQNRAATDDIVTIVQPGSILSGRGFTVSTTTKRYVFRSEVKSRYAPNR